MSKQKRTRYTNLKACPFCVKVRRAMKRQSVQFELRDAKTTNSTAELGSWRRSWVPCLRIEKDGKIEWMYEPSDIVTYSVKSNSHKLTTLSESQIQKSLLCEGFVSVIYTRLLYLLLLSLNENRDINCHLATISINLHGGYMLYLGLKHCYKPVRIHRSLEYR